MAPLPGFSLAQRLRAGETVYTGWCPLGAPIVAETLAREGFTPSRSISNTGSGTRQRP
jgi:2-keto-3-deoxy-L-rhamnonate aldolase RhmA